LSFRSKQFDSPPVTYKPSSGEKVKKLKRLFEKRKHTELSLWDDSGKKSKVTDITVIPPPHQTLSTLPNEDDEGTIRFNPKQLLNNELTEIVDLLILARSTYKDLPDGENASSLAMLLREMRGFVGDLYQITQEDKNTIYRKMDNEIIQPFVRRLIKGIITELDSARKQLTFSLGEDKADEINSSIKTAAKNFRPLFSSQYRDLMQDVAKALDIDQQYGSMMEKLDLAMKDDK
jgi:hypothetical protein